MTLIARLADPTARQSKSARKLSACISADPAAFTAISTAALAELAGVSEPTVHRFCIALGYKGFPDFKLALAAELAQRQPRIARDIEPEDSTGTVAAKIFEAAHASLHDTLQALRAQDIAAAVDALANAGSVMLCGLGASASVATDAQHKLLRFPLHVSAHSDIINQRIAATGLGGGDCLLCISHSGRSEAIIELARLAAQNGATVIAITAAGSPLARECTVTLGVEGGEDTDIYTPMSSRIAQLAVIDTLVACLAQRQPDLFAQHLEQVKRNLRPTRRGTRQRK